MEKIALLLAALFSFVFVVCSISDNVYAQPPYSPAPPSTPPPQLAQQANNTGPNVPIVIRPQPGGTCPQGYHLVSGTVCIKDLPSAAPTKTTPTTNTTNAFSTPLSSTTQPNGTNPSNNNDNSDNEQNFGTKILKSFNEGIK
jgi:hypothetical protein